MAEAEARALLERVRRFQFDRFDSAAEEWTYYIRRFTNELAIYGLNTPETAEHRRNLLLSRVGPDAFKVVVDHFRPAELDMQTYDAVVDVLRNFYQKNICIMAERVCFCQRHRKEGESVTQFLNALRALAGNCDFGGSLTERLRDQLFLGINNDSWQRELFRLHPTNAATLAQVEATALVLEQAAVQQQRIHILTKSAHERQSTVGAEAEPDVRRINAKPFRRGGGTSPSVAAPVTSAAAAAITSGFRSNTAGKLRQLVRGQHCFKCGNKKHGTGEVCPANNDSVVCSACQGRRHFARACLTSGNAQIISSRPQQQQRRQVRAVKVNDWSDMSDVDSDQTYNDLNTIAAVRAGQYAVLSVQLNKHSVQMLYDPGAAFSVISRREWQRIGSPRLLPAADLVAYTKVPIKTLGKAMVVVNAFNQRRRLPVYVIDREDSPLFGLDWLLAFGIELPVGVTVRSVEASTVQSSSSLTATSSPLSTACNDPSLRQLLDEYADVFSPGLGLVHCQEAVVHMDPAAQPRAFSARPVPLHLRDAVEAELNRLVEDGILETVDPMETPIEWASPIVIAIKANGGVRICGDFKVTINPHIVTDNYPLPRFEEIAAKLHGCQYFNVLDLRDAFLQLPVAESSRKYFVIVTHKGYFRYTRLPYGVNFAPNLFQATMDKVLAGVQSTSFIDDIINGGGDKTQTLAVLRATLSVMRQAGLRASLSKCRFLAPSVTYLGHRIDAAGIHPTDDRLRAIREMKAPTNKKQLRSFLGAINHYSKFIPRLQARCAELHYLTRESVRWHWSSEHNALFDELKSILTSDDTLVHYDPDKVLVLSTDASDVGLGACLLHPVPDPDNIGREVLRPIYFASRLLSAVESRYSAVDKEGLGIIYGVKKFEQFLLGRRFILRTDHKPLERIFGANVALPKLAANRLARWAMTLANFDYEVQYHCAANNTTADMLSRFPVDPAAAASESELMGLHSNLLHVKLQEFPVCQRQLCQKTVSDPVLSQVLAFMERGWPTNKSTLPEELYTFFEKRSELSVESGVLLWRGRMVIPAALQTITLHQLHESHPGVSAMRELAKFYVWWSHVDADIEHHVAACAACQRGRSREPEVPLVSWAMPSEPWSRLHADFAGPFEGSMWLVIVDAYTKWLEVIRMKSITSATTIHKLREVFARQGVCRTLVTDNGPQWTSDEFKGFCRSNLIRHITGQPWHPQTNGLAERAVRTFKERMLAAKDSTPDVQLRLQKFLLTYRNTPHQSTGRAPAEMLIGRRLRTCFDLLKPDVRATVDSAHFHQQRQHDKTAAPRSFAAGDPVWVANTAAPGYRPGEILRRMSQSAYVVQLDGRQVRKHADQLRFRRLPDAVRNDSDTDCDAEDSVPVPVVEPPPQLAVSAQATSAGNELADRPLPRRSSRIRHKPVRPYDQYVN
jgi:transposase InsO family protein